MIYRGRKGARCTAWRRFGKGRNRRGVAACRRRRRPRRRPSFLIGSLACTLGLWCASLAPRSSRLSDRHAATTPRRIQLTSCGAMSACGHAHTHAYEFRWGPPDAGLLSLVHVDWCDGTAPFSTFPT